MIINSIEAHNFMRFRDFILHDIPEKGLIGIFGDNETGKSTLGDVIGYCLFGRTPRAESAAPDKLIRWNSDSCSAELIFSSAGQRYRISRLLRRDGSAEGSLTAIPSNVTLASSSEEIAAAAESILGFGFREFRHSTFIAQNELGIILHSTDDRRQVLNNMLGVGFMDRMASKCSDKQKKLLGDAAALRAKLADKTEILDVYRSRLSELEQARISLNDVDARLAEAERNRDQTQSTINLLHDIRRKSDQLSVLDARIKNRREHMRRIEAECSVLIRETERLDTINASISAKQAEISTIKNTSLPAIKVKHEMLRQAADVIDHLRTADSQIAETTAMLDGLAKSLDDISTAEHDFETLRRDLVMLESEIASLPDEASFRKDTAELLRDTEALTQTINDARREYTQRIDTLHESERNLVAQREKTQKQIEGADLPTIDTLQQEALGMEELSARRSRDISAGAGGMFLIAGVALSAAFANPLFMLFALGLIPAGAGAIYMQSKSRDIAARAKQITAASQSWSVSRRNIAEMIDAVKDTDTQLETIRNEIRSLDELGRALDRIRTTGFREIEQAARFLDIAGIPQLESAGNLMKQILSKYDHLLPITGDSLPFAAIFRFEIKSYVREKQARMENLQVRLASAEDLIASRPAVEEKAALIRASLDSLTANAADLRATLGSLGIDNTTEESLKLDNDNLEFRIIELDREIEELRAEAMRLDGLRSEIARLEEDRRATIREIDQDLIRYYELRETVHDIDFSDTRFDALYAQLDQDNSQIDEVTGEHQRISAACERLESELANATSLESDMKSISAAIKNAENNSLNFRELENLFRLTGSDIRKRLVPQIEAYFGWVLPRLTRGRYNRVKLDDDFSISVWSDEFGGFVSLDSLSGGTADQLLISLRLAFARASFASSGNSANFLFLDEPFSAFDESRRELFFSLLQSLKSTFQQIFIISHLPDLEDFVDYYIKLEMTPEQLPSYTSWV